VDRCSVRGNEDYRIAVAVGADRGLLKTQRKSALRLLVQVLDLRVFDSQQLRPLGDEECRQKRNYRGVGRGCDVG
jgi:hypothetical protein